MPKSDYFIVSLMGVIDWLGRLLLDVGFSPAPDEGRVYSWADVIDRQLEFVARSLGLAATRSSRQRHSDPR